MENPLWTYLFFNRFCARIDFSKAFDRVNYWHLFNKLLDDNVSFDVVRLLAFWYSHQNVAVRWHNNISKSFAIHNGTRQGSALSTYLFTRYIWDILLCITIIIHSSYYIHGPWRAKKNFCCFICVSYGPYTLLQNDSFYIYICSFST